MTKEINVKNLPSSRKEAKAVKSQFYLTGKPCPRKHIAKRYTSAGTCTACTKIHSDNLSPNRRRRKNIQTAELNALRIARKKQQVPDDYNQEEVRRYYATAAMLTELTEENWEVDHNIPLSRGGLHHKKNLSVMPKAANMRKARKTLEELRLHDFSVQILNAFKVAKLFEEKFGYPLEEHRRKHATPMEVTPNPE
jgi:hypothetical protein